MSEILESIRSLKLYEASLGRLIQHLGKDCILMISADRGENSKSENNSNYNELKNLVNTANFGYNKVIGSYIEETDDGKFRKVLEKLLVIYAKVKDKKALYQLGISLSKKIKQDSFLFIDEEGNSTYEYMKDGIRKRDKLGKFKFTNLGDYYTKIGKKNFSIESISEETKSSSRIIDGWRGNCFKKILEEEQNPIEVWEERCSDVPKEEYE